MPHDSRRCRRWLPRTSTTGPALLLLVALGAAGCMFRSLGHDLEVWRGYATLRGQVSVEPPSQNAIVVVLYSGDGGAEQVVDTYVQAAAGAYFFVVPPGTYRIAAFEDRGSSLVYDAGGDPATTFNGGAAIAATSGATIGGLDLFLRTDSEERLPFAVVLSEEDRGVGALPNVRLGEVVALDDARFSDANASLGLWRPVEFIFDVGPGIYFLEPHDEAKTPVLFIHGALGHPGIWREMVARLDRDRFQPWFAYYPTAASLDVISTAIERWMQHLWFTHGFERFLVVAHSMGGLVARDFTGRMVRRGLYGDHGVALLLTMATPWQGQAGAGLGVEQAPVVAPSWVDLAPGSEFLHSLWREPLPPEVPYHLLFTFGGGSRIMSGANDGAVTLASQLDPAAQAAAVQVYGFDLPHGAILRDPTAAAMVAGILAAAAD